MTTRPETAANAPLAIELHLARTRDAGDPHAFSYGKDHHGSFTYLRTRADGTSAGSELAWDEGVFSDLAGLRSATPDPARLPGLGGRLQAFLAPLGWDVDARALRDPDRAVHVTLQLGAAELFALPWEATPLPSGERLGKLPRCLLRYAWPGSTAAPRAPDPPPEHGRILVAGSAGGRGVPYDEHLAAIRRACEGSPDIDSGVVELPDVSLRSLGEALSTHAPVHVLHLVCHGSAVESNRALYGLRLRTSDGAGYETVDAERLADKLRPHAGSLRLVVLCACHGGDAGAVDSRVGSVALALHRIGVPAVVASRYPLSWDGSNLVAEELYQKLLVERTSLEEAFLAARARLVGLSADEGNVDWASLQLYARAEDGPDQRPIVFRPYRGLLSFQREHARYFCGRKREIDEAVLDLMKLVESDDPPSPRFLVVTGASGTGKSSLVLAGVIPELLRRDPGWIVPPALRPTLGWAAALEQALSTRREPTAPLLLVVDQLEELFTVLSDAAARGAFVRRLWDLARDPASRVSVMATLRVDFLGRCGEIELDDHALYLERVVYDEAHRVFVQRMGQEELGVIIEQPAAAVGLALDEGLAARMLEDAGDEPGALPLCEYTLDELWKSRRGRVLSRVDYDRLGGVAGALAKKAGAILAGLDEVRRRAARRLLVQLVDARDDAALDTRRRVRREDLRRGPAAEAAVFDEVLDTLARERLLVIGDEGDAPTIEVAHEQLIRSFAELRAWVREDRVMLAELAHLTTWVVEARAYDQVLAGKKLAYARVLVGKHEHEIEPEARDLLARSEASEARRKRRRGAVRALIGLVTVLFAVLAVVAWSQRAAAVKKAAEARDASLMAGARELLSRGRSAPATLLLREVAAPERAPGWTQVALDVLSTSIPKTTLNGHLGVVMSAAWSPDGRRIVTASSDGTARVWGARGAGDPIVLPLQGTVRSAAFSPDGERVVATYQDGLGHVWTRGGSGEVLEMKSHEAASLTKAFSPDGKRVVTAHQDGTALVSEVDGSGKPIELKGHQDAVSSVAWSPDGRRVATASMDRTARVWELDGSGRFLELRGHEGGVRSAAFSPDGRYVVTASFDKTACIWEIDDPTRVVDLGEAGKGMPSAAFSADGKRVVTRSPRRIARLWALDGASGALVLEKTLQTVRFAAFSPDGKHVLTELDDGSASVAQIDGAGRPIELKARPGPLDRAVFSPDGTRVILINSDHTPRVWELDGSNRFIDLFGHTGTITAAAFSADGKRIATGSMDKTARVWDLDGSGKHIELTGHRAGVHSAVFSADGRRVVTASSDKTVRAWDLDGSGKFQEIKGAQDEFYGFFSAAFSPDGRRIVTTSGTKTARVWDLYGGGVLLELKGHQDAVVSAVFSPDGQRILTTSLDGSARIWGVSVPVLRRALEKATTDCLSFKLRQIYLGDLDPDARERHDACERSRLRTPLRP